MLGTGEIVMGEAGLGEVMIHGEARSGMTRNGVDSPGRVGI